MPLLTREEAELLRIHVAQLRRESAKALAERRINGFDKLRLDQECDAFEQWIANKLAGTFLILSDQAAMRKSPRYLFALRVRNKATEGRKAYSGWVVRQGGTANWRAASHVETAEFTDKFESNGTKSYIRRDGITVVRVWPRKGKAEGQEQEQQEPNTVPEATEVSVEEGMELAKQEGTSVMFRPDGRECALVLNFNVGEAAAQTSL